jgi:hypothetical protein
MKSLVGDCKELRWKSSFFGERPPPSDEAARMFGQFL